MVKKIPEWLMHGIRVALLGEIYPQIRAIAVRYTLDKTLLIRYYLDREPTEMDYESISMVETEIFAGAGRQNIEKSELECVYSTARLGSLDCLDGFIYARKEYFD